MGKENNAVTGRDGETRRLGCEHGGVTGHEGRRPPPVTRGQAGGRLHPGSTPTADGTGHWVLPGDAAKDAASTCQGQKDPDDQKHRSDSGGF